MTTDILVIGSGISGLTYSIKIAEQLPEIELVLIAKDELLETNTRYAQGGIAVVSDFKQDSFKKHIKDTLIAGDGMCEASVVQFVIEEGHQRLKELQEWGTQFDTLKEELHLTKEGGHSEKRIVHYKDQTGLQIQEALIKKIKIFPQCALSGKSCFSRFNHRSPHQNEEQKMLWSLCDFQRERRDYYHR